MNNPHELINEYLDWYENLLTDKQKEILNMYYREDYSLKEIGENLNISRSAVSDLINRVNRTLETYEKNLHLVEKFHFRSNAYEELGKIDNKDVQKIIEKLTDNE